MEGGYVCDATRNGSLARYVNHSHSPNCTLEKWIDERLPQLVLVTTTRVPAGTELTFSYNISPLSGPARQACLCGSTLCPGIIGAPPARKREPTATVGGLCRDNGFAKPDCGVSTSPFRLSTKGAEIRINGRLFLAQVQDSLSRSSKPELAGEITKVCAFLATQNIDSGKALDHIFSLVGRRDVRRLIVQRRGQGGFFLAAG
jgi:hypothetical protein